MKLSRTAQEQEQALASPGTNRAGCRVSGLRDLLAVTNAWRANGTRHTGLQHHEVTPPAISSALSNECPADPALESGGQVRIIFQTPRQSSWLQISYILAPPQKSDPGR